MILEQRIQRAEADLFATLGTEVEELFLPLGKTGLRVRVLAHGSGPPLVLLHGVSLSAVAWAPLFRALPGWRLLAVDLPGHGLSDPTVYRRGHVRKQACQLLGDIFDGLELDRAPVVGHSLGGMLALWHCASGARRISGLVAIGDPGVALPGVRVRMPLSLLTVRGVGLAVLRSPSPRFIYRRLLAQGLGPAEVTAIPGPLLEALHLSSRRPDNASTVASLMHAINRFRRPRPESVLTSTELATIPTPTIFIWGADDPYLRPQDARPSIEQIPSAALHEMPAGHGPWLVNPEHTAELIHTHLAGIMSERRRTTRRVSAPTRARER
jgi:pimeloyl-ACP methyl ester carboxylesterase